MKAYIVEYEDPDQFLNWTTVYAENKNDVEDRFRTMIFLPFTASHQSDKYILKVPIMKK